MISFETLANEVILSLWWSHSKCRYDAQRLGWNSFVSRIVQIYTGFERMLLSI